LKLELQGFTVRYGTGAGQLTAVDGIDLGLAAGHTVGLVGESGCGKSTVARAIVGLVPIAGGKLLLDGDDHTSMSRRNGMAFRRRVQMIFQDPYSSLNPRMTVGDMLSEAVNRVPGRTRSQRQTEPGRLLDMVGIARTALARYPHQFSGGQRQRLAIARALAVGPEVIINDEVTSALDVSVQGTILNLLRNIQRELNLSYVFISHDLSTVRYMSDSVSVMYLGRIVESGDTQSLFTSPQHPYTRALMESVPQVGSNRRPAPLSGDLPDPRRPPEGCRFHTRCPWGPVSHPERTICIEQDPQEGAAARAHRAACHFVEAEIGSSAPQAVEAT
jgi:oligopeptide/dipeptide ABC transporter ATP-binding protein